MVSQVERGEKMKILTAAEAWSPREDEKLLGIIGREKFTFRRKWFRNRNCVTFSTFLPNQYPLDRPHFVLTIGVFEGAQEVWCMQHLLRHPESRLVGIDPWLTLEHHRKECDQVFVDQCYENSKNNLSFWKEQVSLIRGKSQDVLGEALLRGSLAGIPMGMFDLAIIDGDHQEDAVFIDAVNCYEMVRRGGWILFDDVRCRTRKVRQVKEGLTRFLKAYEGKVEWVWGHRFCECYVKV